MQGRPPGKIRATKPRSQKNDKRDAALILELMMPQHNFLAIWVPSVEQRDVRALLWHRHQLVGLRTQVQSALQAIALSHGRRKSTAL